MPAIALNVKINFHDFLFLTICISSALHEELNNASLVIKHLYIVTLTHKY